MLARAITILIVTFYCATALAAPPWHTMRARKGSIGSLYNAGLKSRRVKIFTEGRHHGNTYQIDQRSVRKKLKQAMRRAGRYEKLLKRGSPTEKQLGEAYAAFGELKRVWSMLTTGMSSLGIIAATKAEKRHASNALAKFKMALPALDAKSAIAIIEQNLRTGNFGNFETAEIVLAKTAAANRAQLGDAIFKSGVGRFKAGTTKHPELRDELISRRRLLDHININRDQYREIYKLSESL